MMVGTSIASVFALLFYIAIPAVILYFIIKLAIKNAIRELKQDNIL